MRCRHACIWYILSEFFGVATSSLGSFSDALLDSLDWSYSNQVKKISVDVYEECRDGDRKSKSQMRLPPSVRAKVLTCNWDYSLTSIIRATRKLQEDRKGYQAALSKNIKHLRRQERRKNAYTSFKNVLNVFRKITKRTHAFQFGKSSDISSCSSTDEDECASLASYQNAKGSRCLIDASSSCALKCNVQYNI